MSYASQAMSDAPMPGYCQTSLIAELMEEVSGNAAAADGEMTDVSAKILDEAPDLSDDELGVTVPGIDGSLGRMIFNIGKYQKAGALMTFKTAYETDKKYVAWVRKFVKGKSSNPEKSNHPTMSQFRLYIALRDQRKSLRLQTEPEASRQQVVVPPPSVMAARPKAKATAVRSQPKAKAMGVTRNGPMTQGAMSAASSAQRRDAPGAPASLDPRADRDAHLSAGGAAGSRGRGPVRFATSADEMISTMSSAERKLCRRGVEACSRKPVELYGVHDGVDVMVLERGSGEEVLTAVGLSTTALFEELTPAMIRSSATIEKAVKEIRRLNPKLLVVRPPNHMTKTRGCASMVRTYHAQHRAAYTRLITACCVEQCCEGRLFCLEDVNESMSDRVRQWKKQRCDENTWVVERVESDNMWRMFTNSQHVHQQMHKTWLNMKELQDPKCFMKDVAAGMLRAKQQVHEVHVAHCVFTIEDLRSEESQDDRRVMTILRRCHENLGHPSPARMNMLLRAAHASERVLRLAKGLRCETCDELSKPKSHHVTKLRKATEFNQQVCVDTFEQDVRDMKTHFLNIVDEATGYQMCIPLWKGMQAKHVRNAYRKHWKRWAGPPVRLFCGV